MRVRLGCCVVVTLGQLHTKKFPTISSARMDDRGLFLECSLRYHNRGIQQKRVSLLKYLSLVVSQNEGTPI